MPELLIELFSEEIPARMQARASEDLARLVTDGLKSAGLAFGKVEKFVSPRRLGLAIADIPASRPDLREEKRGPRVGAPAQALQGFLKSVGLTSIDQCEQREVKGAAYYFAVIEQTGGATAAALPEIVAAAIRGLAWPKSMRWAATTFSYVRPLHNILVRFGGKPVPGRFDCGGGTVLDFAGTTFGHRFMAPGALAIEGEGAYRETLRNAFVLADAAERRERIRQEARALAQQHDLTLKDDEALLDEVTGLVEWPVPLLGRIDEDSMKLPPEVLVTSMRSHQKYFALETPERAMAPHFLVVANMVTKDGGAAVIAGNERVLRARLADARFFWDTDRKVPLDSRVAPLDAITWHAKLGSTGEKVRRIEALAVEIAKHIPGAEEDKVRRAARLCKADLTTGMVGEFPELQGVMGRYYAIHDGETEDVADAIAEHWGPMGPSDTCPTAPVSVAVALADKIDTLAGFFAIGEPPTGSRDPFGLRRATLAIIRLIKENKLRVGLADMLAGAISQYLKQENRFVREGIAQQVKTSPQASVREDVIAAYRVHCAPTLMEFFEDRLKVQVKEEGIPHDHIRAIFSLRDVAGFFEDDLVRLLARVEVLRGFIESEDGRNLLVAYRRAANIVRIEAKKDKLETYPAPDPAAFTQAEEKALATALDGVAAESAALVEREDFAGAMRLLAGLRAPVDAFFDKVTVNAPEPDQRRNRLALLQRLAATMDKIADFSKIEG